MNCFVSYMRSTDRKWGLLLHATQMRDAFVKNDDISHIQDELKMLLEFKGVTNHVKTQEISNSIELSFDSHRHISYRSKHATMRKIVSTF